MSESKKRSLKSVALAVKKGGWVKVANHSALDWVEIIKWI